MKKLPYYDYGPILSQNAQINIICAMRGPGKTYGAKKYVLDRFFKTGEQFVFVRRTDVTKEESKSKFLADIGSRYANRGKLYIFGDELYFKENNETQSVLVGTFLALSLAENYKGGSYQNVKTIVFDEFMTTNGYYSNELLLFMSIFETVFRDREDCKLIMLSNTMSVVCPYYEAFNIQIKPDFKGTIKRSFSFTNEEGKKVTLKVVLDIPDCENYKNHKKASPSGMLAQVLGLSNYMIDGEFMFDDTTNILENVNKSLLQFRYNLIVDGEPIGIYFHGNLMFIGDTLKEGKNFCTNPDDCLKYNGIFVDKQWNNFNYYKKMFKAKAIYYKDLKVKNIFISLMRKIMKGF